MTHHAQGLSFTGFHQAMLREAAFVRCALRRRPELPCPHALCSLFCLPSVSFSRCLQRLHIPRRRSLSLGFLNRRGEDTCKRNSSTCVLECGDGSFGPVQAFLLLGRRDRGGCGGGSMHGGGFACCCGEPIRR